MEEMYSASISSMSILSPIKMEIKEVKLTCSLPKSLVGCCAK